VVDEPVDDGQRHGWVGEDLVLRRFKWIGRGLPGGAAMR
jgi:hypothetical protein